VVFLPSKVRAGVPVLNRYYGVFEDGRTKARGIMARRRDTPELIRRAQMDMLEVVAKAWDAVEFMERIPEAVSVLSRYAGAIAGGRVRAEELAIHRQLSRHPLAYGADIQTAIAARQMLDAGVELQPGQTVAYVITRADARRPELRVRALPLAGRGGYDGRWYLDFLLEAAEELFGPFGYGRDRVMEVLKRGRQARVQDLGSGGQPWKR
jgi:DNA polymerase elongation subunit (family B)